MKTILATARKELNSYFSSPLALIFVGVFLVATLFSFFWVNTFFARGIADVRLMFSSMPVLLIFLVAALTMRQWSEEQRSGTLEMLLTLPVQPLRLVIGKFLAVITLVIVALALTLPLVFTVSLLGNLDFGPVVGGYLAAILLAGSYAAIGLYVSSRTDNQIVALIVTVLICGLFYVVGNSTVTGLFSANVADILRNIGTGSRFESIERGVIDFRDLVYYLSLSAVFLTLNTLALDRKRWSTGKRTASYRRNMNLTSGLLAANLLVLNVWVTPLQGLRADLTEQHEYTLSQATLDLIGNLQEPLTIRAYISEKTHPLLSPLIPQVRDMLREYQIASGGKIKADVVDPASDASIEEEAGRTYGIQPTPLQVSGRYEASVINAYFDILVRYGDQNVVLHFSDLIQVEQQNDGNVNVSFRNLEYDLTRSIKKVAYGFQSIDSVFASFKDPIKLYLVVTPNTLPQTYQDAPSAMQKVANDLARHSGGKLSVQEVNPDDPNATITRQQLSQQFNLNATQVSFFSNDTYYLNMLLVVGNKGQLVYPQNDFSEANVRAALESALKRNASGFLKVVGVWSPQPQQDAYGQSQGSLESYQMISQQLQRDYTVKSVDLTTGQVPPDVDVLLLIGPTNMTQKDLYAIDQYLMSGGSVVVAGGNFSMASTQTGGLGVQQVQGGVSDLLASYGITVGMSLVMDPQNEPFPTQVARKVNGLTVNEIQAVNYPFFVDVRSGQMDSSSPIVNSLTAVTLNWASPVELDAAKNAGRKTSVLMSSTSQAWLRTNTDIQPDYETYPDLGFAAEGERKAYPLAVSVQGVFQSYFKDKTSPLLEAPTAQAEQSGAAATATPQVIRPTSALQQSPDTARLVVIGSSEFLNDNIMQLSSRLNANGYQNSLQLAQNSVDWSVEDLDLLGIRARGTTTHTLKPLTESDRTMWEVINYVVALVALIGIGIIWRTRQRSEVPMELVGAVADTTDQA
jgi:ABC-2 type transport system permease protein